MALIDILHRAVGLRPSQPLAGQLLIGRSAGWWWPFEQAVILTERPRALDLAHDEQGRLHHPTGPVVSYPDGWAAWAWHGVRVPRQVIERPNTITVAQIRNARNLEVRRVLLERYGLDRYLRDADASLVQVDEYGKLWRCELADDEPLTIVEVVNATRELRRHPCDLPAAGPADDAQRQAGGGVDVRDGRRRLPPGRADLTPPAAATKRLSRSFLIRLSPTMGLRYGE
jgi:hypothetical protein